MHRVGSLALIGLLACAVPASGQDDDAPPAGEGFRFGDWQDWVTVESDDAPEPPLLRLQVGLLASIDVKTEVKADKANLIGTRLNDLETDQGLASSGLAPWVELSLGGAIRAGADMTWLLRFGDFTRQTQAVVFDGRQLADPGEQLKSQTSYFDVGAFGEWDFLYGKNYRIGVVGGARYLRLDVELTGLRQREPILESAKIRGELLSPFFGGLVELSPFPYLSVCTQIQFMNWSWQQIGLKKTRYVRFRLGFTVRPTSWLGFGAEYWFEVVKAESHAQDRSDSQFRGGLALNSVLLHVELAF